MTSHTGLPAGGASCATSSNRSAAAHAALVMDADVAIAWAEYGTGTELPTIHHRKQYDAEKDRDPDYRITCVFGDRR